MKLLSLGLLLVGIILTPWEQPSLYIMSGVFFIITIYWNTDLPRRQEFHYG